MATNTRKKCMSICKERKCEGLQPWISSIINHLDWSVVSSTADS